MKTIFIAGLLIASSVTAFADPSSRTATSPSSTSTITTTSTGTSTSTNTNTSTQQRTGYINGGSQPYSTGNSVQSKRMGDAMKNDH